MPRPRSPHALIQTQILMPEDLRGRMMLSLYSPTEQRVPYGAVSNFINNLIREFFEREDQARRHPNP